MAIYKAQVDTPYGLFLVAVKSTEYDARQDILFAARSELPSHYVMTKIKSGSEVQKSNTRILKKMCAIKNCVSNGEFWGYIKRL